MPRVMRVVGKVVGKVTIRDIGKDIGYNDIVDIQESDVMKSNDIVEAFKERWIDIIFGKEILDSHPKYSTPLNMNARLRDTAIINQASDKTQAQPQIDLTQLISGLHASIREIIKSELANNSQANVVDQKPNDPVNHEQLATLIADQLAGKLQSSSTNVEKSIAIDKESQNVFINLDDNTDLKGNLGEADLGKVVESSDGKASDAIKRLSQLKKGKQ